MYFVAVSVCMCMVLMHIYMLLRLFGSFPCTFVSRYDKKISISRYIANIVYRYAGISRQHCKTKPPSTHYYVLSKTHWQDCRRPARPVRPTLQDRPSSRPKRPDSRDKPLRLGSTTDIGFVLIPFLFTIIVQ